MLQETSAVAINKVLLEGVKVRQSLLGKAKLIGMIILVLVILALVPQIPIPFSSSLWNNMALRHNIVHDLEDEHLIGQSKKDVLTMLGSPTEEDKKGIESEIYLKGNNLYYLVPFWWGNQALLIRFDNSDHVSQCITIDGQ